MRCSRIISSVWCSWSHRLMFVPTPPFWFLLSPQLRPFPLDLAFIDPSSPLVLWLLSLSLTSEGGKKPGKTLNLYVFCFSIPLFMPASFSLPVSEPILSTQSSMTILNKQRLNQLIIVTHSHLLLEMLCHGRIHLQPSRKWTNILWILEHMANVVSLWPVETLFYPILAPMYMSWNSV